MTSMESNGVATKAQLILLSLVILTWSNLRGTSQLSAADGPAKTKIRIATASPSLSYFPIYAAVQKGFFARRGFEVEMIQMAPSLRPRHY